MYSVGTINKLLNIFPYYFQKLFQNKYLKLLNKESKNKKHSYSTMKIN